MKNVYVKTLLVTVAAVGLLAACGGDSNDPAPTPSGQFVSGTQVPVGVEQSVGNVIAFAQQQIAATSDSTDPVLIGDAKLATDDTVEPASI